MIRHPRFTLGLGFLVLCTFLLLASQDAIPTHTALFGGSNPRLQRLGHSVQTRLEKSEESYQRVLKQRKGLIQKYGPTADKIDMFPPSVAPYPPYTVWDFFPAAFNCPYEVERLGALGDGGKWTCGISRLAAKRDCVVYSVGINYESSFEAEILQRTSGCQIWGYDYSVKSFGPEIPATQQFRTHFFPYALGGTDDHGPDANQKFYTLPTLMKNNDHDFIDVLKIDIESWEFDTLRDVLNSYRERGESLPFGQLQLEIHVWDRKFPEFLRFFENLEDMGLRPFWTEPNLVYANYNRQTGAELAEYSFINIRGNHTIITDDERYVQPPASESE